MGCYNTPLFAAFSLACIFYVGGVHANKRAKRVSNDSKIWAQQFKVSVPLNLFEHVVIWMSVER